MSKEALVSIVMGSDSDLDIMKHAAETLDNFGIKNEMTISSAHRTPDETAKYAKEAAARGVKVIIAAAGYSAHLAGVIAAHTVLPVIGVPLEASALNGIDSLLSIVQMPSGIPVACVTIGKAGAINAAILAAEILATSDESMQKKLTAHRKKMCDKVVAKNRSLNT